MYNKYCRADIDNFFARLNERRNKLPSEIAIFNLLETFSYDSCVIGDSVEFIQKEIINYAFTVSKTNPMFTNRRINCDSSKELELIDKQRSDDITTNYKYVDYRNIVVTKEQHKNMGYDDLIWLHFSIVPEQIQAVALEIIRLLNDNNISYYMRVPNVIGPDAFVIGVCTKGEANLLLESCKNNRIVQENIMINNPFLPHRYGIGVIKETEKRCYTRHLSSLIYEYAITSKEKRLSFRGFCRFVAKKFDEERTNRTYQERFLDYNVALANFSIYEEQDFLDNLVHLPPIIFKKDEFDKHRVTYENGEYHYFNGEVDITSDNYFEWLKLQAFNCIQRMYYEQNGKLPIEDVTVSEALTAKMSSLIDTIMRGEPFHSTSNYNDVMINELYPYLVGYFAYEAKMTTEEEIRDIVQKVKNRMVTKLNVEGTNKNFYQIGDKTLQSTIPPIRVDNILIGIEYLDYASNYCNIFIYYDDNVQGYLGVFLDIEREKICGDHDIASSMYRAGVARALCQYDSLPKEVITRGAYEGTLIHLGSDEYVPEQQIAQSNKPKV